MGAIGIVVYFGFLACLGLCFWKKLWIALGVLIGVITVSTAFRFALDSPGVAILVAVVGVLAVFPLAIYFDAERREKQERRKTIRRTRRHTGRD